MKTVELSYKNLPDYLKPCFLYFGVFPEDTEISVKRLIRLWMAEGFVHKSESKSLEDIATDNMMDLVGRSLVVVAKQRSIGWVKAFRVHDLLHDFSIAKAKEENFFQLLRGYDELSAFNKPGNMRRLCIHSEPKHFKESRFFCPLVRSLLLFPQIKFEEQAWCDVSFIIHIFKLLKVLDIEQINLGFEFPDEIGQLIRLKYLAVAGEMTCIPSSIGNLLNLEIFIVNLCQETVSLPDTLWNLQKQRYLSLQSRYRTDGFGLPVDIHDNSSNLYDLDKFSGAVFVSRQSMEEQVRKFPNIRKLKCLLLNFWDDTEKCYKILVNEFLHRLESLNVSPVVMPDKNAEFVIGFPKNLRRLTLSCFQLSWSKILTIGELPNLEVLKLLQKSFLGETWDVEEGQFLKLRFLKLAFLDVVRWTASDDCFPELRMLVLESCRKLEEIPSCLENISTLEMIQVSECSDSITSFVKQIQDVQMDMGNSILRIFISSGDPYSYQS